VFDAAGVDRGVVLWPSNLARSNRVSWRQPVPSDRIRQISSPAPSQQTYAMREPSGAQLGPPSVNSENLAAPLRRPSSGWVNRSAPESTATTASEARSRSMYARLLPSGDQPGTPATGEAESRFAPSSSGARRNKPSSLPQATELPVGDHTGMPAGSPAQESVPFSVRIQNTPGLILVETHAVIVGAARLSTTSSHNSGIARRLHFLNIRTERTDHWAIRPESRPLLVNSVCTDCFHSTYARAQHG
jgi:hypothetical protein